MVKINISLRAEEVEERYFSMEIVTTHLRNHLLQNPKKLYKWKSTTFFWLYEILWRTYFVAHFEIDILKPFSESCCLDQHFYSLVRQ